MDIISATLANAKTIAEIISVSNQDVAVQFGIDKDNNPKHPSFYNEEWALSDFERGEEYFLYSSNGEYVGCVAYEQADSGKGYLNRLSVLPNFREQGIGKELTQHIVRYAKLKGVSEISIGIIADHADLKHWYEKLGFQKNGLKKFPHLPFDVLYMKHDLKVLNG
jgi:ribosomal protein S18 acetylase RimI-like enzyme